MIAKSLRLARTNAETLFAIANYGSSAVFWLALAFLMPASDYGQMMTLQAAVYLVVTALTLRTHDLVFFLITKHAHHPDSAFATAFAIECGACVAAIMLCAVGAAIRADVSVGGVALLAGVAAAGAAQGALVARLRYQVRGKAIMAADAACMVAWAMAGLSVLILPHLPLVTILIIGAAPNAVRTLALLLISARVHGEPRGKDSPAHNDWGSIRRFLAGAQLINFLKNGSVSIETIILAAFCPPAAVAMFRLAKSTQGAANAAINVEYQRSYSTLARAGSHAEKLGALHQLQRRSILLCVGLYPLSAAFALAYALQKPDVDALSFQLVTLAAFIAFIPAALQQGPMILLLNAGAHRPINIAYIMSVGLLCLLSLTMFGIPSIWAFLGALIASAVARSMFLSLKAKPFLS